MSQQTVGSATAIQNTFAKIDAGCYLWLEVGPAFSHLQRIDAFGD